MSGEEEAEEEEGEEEDCRSTSSSNNGLGSSQESVDMLLAPAVGFTSPVAFGLGGEREGGSEAMNISFGGGGLSEDDEEGHDDVEDEEEDEEEEGGEGGGGGGGRIEALARTPDEEDGRGSLAGKMQ